MPYEIRKFKDGFRVCKKYEPSKCFSKKPLKIETAKKQKKAIEMSEYKKGGNCCGCIMNQLLEGTGKEEINNQLKKNDLDTSVNEYLKIAKRIAKKKGYNPDLLTISNKKNKKLNYNGVNFGSSLNNDFIIYSLMAKDGQITKDEAKDHRRRYLARAKKIKGEWKSNKESPNNLAINILW